MSEILVIVAHSRKDQGAERHSPPLVENTVSERASKSCFNALTSAKVACTYAKLGWYDDFLYAKTKVKLANSNEWKLTLEMHLNAAENPRAGWSEVIYSRLLGPKSISAQAATHISKSLGELFAREGKAHWRNKGAVAAERNLFLVDQTHGPAAIVEGLFVSNQEHADWLSTGGAEKYGEAVAQGIINFLGDAA